MEAALRAGRKEPHVLAASGRFRGFAPETGQRADAPQIMKDAKLKAMFCAFRKVDISKWFDGGGTITSYDSPLISYDIACQVARNLANSSRDIEFYSIALTQFQMEGLFSTRAGFFLSALMNSSPDKEFVIHTAQLCSGTGPKPYAYIGTKNRDENIIVNGDCGKCIGWGMEGGRIHVEGNVGDFAASCMQGGVIVVDGSASHVGDGMTGGEFRAMEGKEFRLATTIWGGRFFHKEKEIFPKKRNFL